MTATMPPTTAATPTVPIRLQNLNSDLAAHFYERTEVLRAATITLLAGKHMLMLGPPGTAKSDLIRELTARIDQARYFETLMSPFADPTAMFGPIDVAALQQGEYKQLLSGRATDADIVFIDEIFKSGDGALQALLTYLNERKYHPLNGEPPKDCPVLSVFAASNELPQGEALNAFFDRLLVRIEVDYLHDTTNFTGLLRSSGPAPASQFPLTITELNHAVRHEVPQISVPDPVINAYVELRAELKEDGIVASDRRWKQSIRLLQASAYLDGRTGVTRDDMQILDHVLWTEPPQRPTVARALINKISPGSAEAVEIMDAMAALERELDDLLKNQTAEDTLRTWAASESLPKCKNAETKLNTLRQNAQAKALSTKAIDQAEAARSRFANRVVSEALGMNMAAI
ncbi:AAA family ATPase [Saccharopolyspora sp. K220]|uniref:AAA family ATPase n=1 Tax=Saccharopolyspora soli TaxID=2926618 RepID=UPI001F575C53|nr:AAA family ATPase [Saccharopolyspora soli]MCI2421140.1 AAA family ATPase [Saccharopolyspora soli]